MFATNPENEIIVQKLVGALEAAPVGELVPYIVLNKLVGRDVQNGSRYLLLKAQDRAEKNCGCIFESVRSVGIKRLSAAEAPEIGLTAIRRVRRKARRGVRRLEHINSNSMSDGDRKRAIAYRSLLGTIVLMADGNK